MQQLIIAMATLFLAQACVGVNIVVSKGLVDHINPLILLTVRFSIASLFMLLLTYISREKTRFKLTMDINDWLVLVAEGISAGVMFNFIMLIGLHFTDANSSGLITSLMPAVIICLNVMFFRQQLSRKMLISIVISIFGLLLINYGTVGAGSKNALLGNFLVFVSLIPDSLYYALSKYHPLKLNPMLKVLLLNAINLPVLYLSIIFLPHGSWSVITLHDSLMMSVIGITSALFFILWQKGIKHIDAAYAALSTAFMPLATVILAWVILGEGLGLAKLIGMILVIMSIVNYALKK